MVISLPSTLGVWGLFKCIIWITERAPSESGSSSGAETWAQLSRPAELLSEDPSGPTGCFAVEDWGTKRGQYPERKVTWDSSEWFRKPSDILFLFFPRVNSVHGSYQTISCLCLRSCCSRLGTESLGKKPAWPSRSFPETARDLRGLAWVLPLLCCFSNSSSPYWFPFPSHHCRHSGSVLHYLAVGWCWVLVDTIDWALGHLCLAQVHLLGGCP